MAKWITPVYDRTQADVEYAKSQISQHKNDVELKGCLNVSDILRIENNTQFLSDKLCELYYFQNPLNIHSWTIEGIPTHSHIDRIIHNVNMMWEGYYVPTGSDELPYTMLHYEDINAIEKNQMLIKNKIEEMTGYFRECNTFECGEERLND